MRKFLEKLYDLSYSIMFGSIAGILLITIGNFMGFPSNITSMYVMTTSLSISKIALTAIKFFLDD